jgi:copper chaperone
MEVYLKMEQKTFNVEGMSCSHCVNAITKAVKELHGIGSVDVSLEEKTVNVTYNAAKISNDALKIVIEDCGYDVV